MVTGNVFQILIDLTKKLLAILLVRQQGFNREGPVQRVEIEEDFPLVKWSSKFIETKLFRILWYITRSAFNLLSSNGSRFRTANRSG